MEWSILKLFAIIPFLTTSIGMVDAYDDLPCDPRSVFNRSVMCRCTSSYCDTVIREVPAEDELITYTSSDSGLRFDKQSYSFKRRRASASGIIINIDPGTKYQTINGFGGAVTDSTGINWQNLNDPQLKQHMIDSYCGNKGIEYNMFRVPIGGTDFSTRFYAYNEYPVGDKYLTNFTLAPEDYNYKLPFIKACMEVATEDIHIVASCWSPPTWMKIRNTFLGVNYLREEYYQTYADYFLKFVDEYKKQGVLIWGLTTTNEPQTNIVDFAPISSLGWTVPTMANWIADYFGPTIKKHHPQIKLIGVDDQRNVIPVWLNEVVINRPEVLDYLDGVGVHFYLDDYIPAETVAIAMKPYPKLFALATEAAFAASKTEWGSWDRAATYTKDIIDDLNVNMIGWIDWNMALNANGGPSLNDSLCDSTIIVMPEEGAFYKQPMFYAMGHFAKFLPRGSRRIKLEISNNSAILYSVAALTPRNTVVVVLNNWENTWITVTLRLRYKNVKISLPPRSIVTAEFVYDSLIV